MTKIIKTHKLKYAKNDNKLTNFSFSTKKNNWNYNFQNLNFSMQKLVYNALKT